MSVLHGCSLCKPADFIKAKLEARKKPFLVYSIFIILLIEWLSLIYLKYYHITTEKITDVYVAKISPFLTNLALFVVLFSLFLWKDRLHFCFRKSATTFYLSCYYLFNCIAILTCLNATNYYNYISIGLLGFSTFLFIVSFLNAKK